MDTQAQANLFSKISLYGQVGGAVLGAIGAYSAAKGAKANARAQAEIAQTNARISEIQAKQSLVQGHHQAFTRSLKAGQTIGQQKAAMAANGVRINSGSASEVIASEEVVKDWDMKTIEDNALMSAWGYRMQAAGFEGHAAAASATAAGISPLAAGATSLLADAGQVAQAWYQYKKNAPTAADNAPSGYTSDNLGRVVGMNQAFDRAGISAFAPKDPYQPFRHRGW